MRIQDFITGISEIEFENVFNPYTDVCKVYDKAYADKIRRNNLLAILDSLEGQDVDSIWLGRDLGHRGGRRTGIALTDESNLEFAIQYWNVRLERATVGKKFQERTASNIWSALSKVNKSIFLWNVFPFHAHNPGEPFTNRSHNALERDMGLEILSELVSILTPRKIVAVGNDAFHSALRIYSTGSVVKVRHPSYGGEKVFRRQISEYCKSLV